MSSSHSLPNPTPIFLPIPRYFFPLIKTTLPSLPLPPNASRPPTTTSRLLIRPLTPSDLPALHLIRSDPSIMINNPQGHPDTSLDETKPRLGAFLPPNDTKTYNFAICLKETGEMIGIGGCHRLDATSLFGWPVIGYQLRREYWGRGLTTEFLKAWLGMWCALPREEVVRRVHPRTVVYCGEGDGEGETRRVEEVVSSWVLSDNVASQRVLEKCGMELCLVQRERDLRDETKEVELRVYRYLPGKRGS